MLDDQARVLRWLAGLLVGTAVLAIILILSGTFDPKPAGALAWEKTLRQQTIPAGSRQIVWLEQETPRAPYSLRLTAAHFSGETDIGYGIVLGRDGDNLAVAVSPLGYAAIWEEQSSLLIPHSSLLPWQTWPHVRAGENEIWLDVGDGRVTVRINREWLWEGEVEAGGQIGLAMESFGETAVIDFQTLQLFTE